MNNAFSFKVKLKTDYVIDQDDLCHLAPGNKISEPPMFGRDNDDSNMVPSEEIVYIIYGELTTGLKSYGRSYVAFRGSDVERTNPVFIKTPRLSIAVSRSPEVSERLGQIQALFENVCQNQAALETLNRLGKTAANILGRGTYRVLRESHKFHVPFLVQEFINELPLELFLTEYKDGKYRNQTKFGGITEPEDWFLFASNISNIIRRIHNMQIIHGEIVPKNLLVGTSKDKLSFCLVDFARSAHLDVRLVTGPLFRQTNSYLAPESRGVEAESSIVADIYSLGGLLLYLATGDDPPDINEPSDLEPAQRGILRDTDNWKGVIHQRFSANEKLMSTHEGIVKIIDKCMRPNPSDRFPSVEKMLQALSAVNYKQRTQISVPNLIEQIQKRWQEEWAAPKDNHSGSKQTWDELFKIIVGDKLEILQKEMTDMNNGHYEIYGEREDIIDTLNKYITVLEPGDVYVTATMPNYWTEKNLGINGRFLTVNKDLVRHGVLINRMFLTVDADFEEKSESRRILTAHVKAWLDLGRARHVTPSWNASWSNDANPKEKADSGAMYLGVMNFPSDEERLRFHRHMRHVALWRRRSKGRTIAIVFFTKPEYTRQDGKMIEVGSQIVKVRFRELEDDADYIALQEAFKSDLVAGPLEMAKRLKMDVPAVL